MGISAVIQRRRVACCFKGGEYIAALGALGYSGRSLCGTEAEEHGTSGTNVDLMVAMQAALGRSRYRQRNYVSL
jgi:hypothetical protein